MDDDFDVLMVFIAVFVACMLMFLIFLLMPRPESILIERDSEGRITGMHYLPMK